MLLCNAIVLTYKFEKPKQRLNISIYNNKEGSGFRSPVLDKSFKNLFDEVEHLFFLILDVAGV